jgi:hypothetical protein
LPGFASVKARFAKICRSKAYLTRSRSEWVRHQEFKEWADWVCEMDQDREWRGIRWLYFSSTAPARRNTQARALAAQCARVPVRPHPTRVCRPVDACWAKQLKGRAGDSCPRFAGRWSRGRGGGGGVRGLGEGKGGGGDVRGLGEGSGGGGGVRCLGEGSGGGGGVRGLGEGGGGLTLTFDPQARATTGGLRCGR